MLSGFERRNKSRFYFNHLVSLSEPFCLFVTDCFSWCQHQGAWMLWVMRWMHGRSLGQHPHSQCSVHTHPLGTLRRSVSGSGMWACLHFLQTSRGCQSCWSMDHTLKTKAKEAPLKCYQGSSIKSAMPTGLQLPAPLKAQEAWKAHWECQQETIWRVFPGGKFQSGEGLLRPSAPGSGHPGTPHSSGGR